jgi:hypothetical protein
MGECRKYIAWHACMTSMACISTLALYIGVTTILVFPASALCSLYMDAPAQDRMLCNNLCFTTIQVRLWAHPRLYLFFEVLH